MRSILLFSAVALAVLAFDFVGDAQARCGGGNGRGARQGILHKLFPGRQARMESRRGAGACSQQQALPAATSKPMPSKAK